VKILLMFLFLNGVFPLTLNARTSSGSPVFLEMYICSLVRKVILLIIKLKPLGPTESYVDKHVASEYGYYVSSAEENYDYEYIRPQESGSHHACKYMAIKNLFKVTAEHPFSCSVNPFTTEQLRETLHSFELTENDFVNVCIDLAMRGVGSHSCGPDLPDEYEIPKKFKNTFTFTF